MKILLPLLLASVMLASGCIGQVSVPGVDSKYCSADADCACGVHVSTGECFYGNSAFVNTEVQCPDFCTGIAGNLDIKCEGGRCVQKVVR